MFFHLQVFLYSLIFYVVMEFAASDGVASFLGSVIDRSLFLFLCIAAIAIGYFVHVARKVSKRWVMTPMPVLFVISSFGLLYFVSSPSQQHIFTLLASIAFFFILIALHRIKLYTKDLTARGIVSAGVIATIFLCYVDSLGIYLNYDISLWFLMVFLMAITTLLSFQFFSLVHESRKIVLYASLILGFIIGEIVWVVNFWPFGYLTTGAITIIFYYVFWDLMHCHLQGILTKQRVIINVTVLVILASLLLTSTRWLPVV